MLTLIKSLNTIQDMMIPHGAVLFCCSYMLHGYCVINWWPYSITQTYCGYHFILNGFNGCSSYFKMILHDVVFVV